MSVLVCPRCRRVSPDSAAYCWFDGVVLRDGVNGAAGGHRWSRDFVFPSGKRCGSLEDFARACRDEWEAARELLQEGHFAAFFATQGRGDLAHAVKEAARQPSPDAALAAFLGNLPGTAERAPKLDIQPRRIALGHMLSGETRQVTLTVGNQGEGILQGTIAVTAGSDWLRLLPQHAAEGAIHAPRQQKIQLQVDPRGQPAGQNYGAVLTVVTNGGVAEVPVRLDLVARPFPHPPFQGARTPRELAEGMRRKPKVGIPLLESGDVARWFQDNGWLYPIHGAPVPGIAGVQQFFEGLGLSRAPAVRFSQPEVRFRCHWPEPIRFQTLLVTASKKWIYATSTSATPWLKVLTPTIAGPRQALIGLEVDPRSVPGGAGEALVNVTANGGQHLQLRVHVEVVGKPVDRPSTPPPVVQATSSNAATTALGSGTAGPSRTGLVGNLLAMILLAFFLRSFLGLVVDGAIRPAAVAAAADRSGRPIAPGSPLDRLGGWLQLPWPAILLGGESALPGAWFASEAGALAVGEFRGHFLTAFLRRFVLAGWWLGPVLGVWWVVRRTGWRDAAWGVGAGCFLGLVGAATGGCLFLLLDLVPHLLWTPVLGGEGGGFGLWLTWEIFAVAAWMGIGAAAAWLGSLVPPLRDRVIHPVRRAWWVSCRLFGWRTLADTFA